MICNISIWDDFMEHDDTTIQIESSDFSQEVEIEILQYVKATIASADIISEHNMEIEKRIYNDTDYYHIELRDVTYDQVNQIVKLFNCYDSTVNTYSGIYLNVYAES